MNPFSIVLLVLIGLYIGVWCLDRFLFTPRREKRTLPEINARLDEIEKRLHDLDAVVDVVNDTESK